MKIRNRMPDVQEIRDHACQDFIKFFLCDNWQQELFTLTKKAIKNQRQKIRYIATYEKMCDIGIENYNANDMDMTIIYAIVDASRFNIFHSMKKMDKSTYKALKSLKDDRNVNGHTTSNEEDDELYLRGLLALCNLKNFIRTVHINEKSITDEERLFYRQKYIPKIEKLKNILDEERIELIQWKKQIDKDIQKIKESNNPSYAWLSTFDFYRDRCWNIDHDYEKYFYFIIQASNYGIEQSHSLAVSHFTNEKDYSEAERRLCLCQ